MLEGWEWLIIGVVAIVIIMWGPAKIPEFARSLGRAKGEFSKAQKEFTNAATLSEAQPAPTVPAAATVNTTVAPAPAPVKSKDETLVSTARNLGISTDGKTREQLTSEINEKVKSLGSD
jgi:sec-independent protein translocase protein TatA